MSAPPDPRQFTKRDLVCGRLVLWAMIVILFFAPENTLTAADKSPRRMRLQVTDQDLAAAQALMDQITALSPRVRPEEAARLAECVYNTTRQLRRDYQVVWPPLFNNFLVNSGIRKRGLCFHWAEDLLIPLDGLKLTSLEFHWGEAHVAAWQESNCVVVTAKGQPFNDGIILDAWRRFGHLYWRAVAMDKMPWVENRAYAGFVRAKSAATANRAVASQRKIERQTTTSRALGEISVNAQ